MFALTLTGPYTSVPFAPPATARFVVITVTVGPLPDVATVVRAIIQQRDPGGVWANSGGISGSGSAGDVFEATSHLTCAPGRRFRARVDVVGGPVSVTSGMTVR